MSFGNCWSFWPGLVNILTVCAPPLHEPTGRVRSSGERMYKPCVRGSTRYLEHGFKEQIKGFLTLPGENSMYSNVFNTLKISAMFCASNFSITVYSKRDTVVFLYISVSWTWTTLQISLHESKFQIMCIFSHLSNVQPYICRRNSFLVDPRLYVDIAYLPQRICQVLWLQQEVGVWERTETEFIKTNEQTYLIYKFMSVAQT